MIIVLWLLHLTWSFTLLRPLSLPTSRNIEYFPCKDQNVTHLWYLDRIMPQVFDDINSLGYFALHWNPLLSTSLPLTSPSSLLSPTSPSLNFVNTICVQANTEIVGISSYMRPVSSISPPLRTPRPYWKTSLSDKLLSEYWTLYAVSLHEVIHTLGVNHSKQFGIMNITILLGSDNSMMKIPLRLWMSEDDIVAIYYAFHLCCNNSFPLPSPTPL